MNRADLEEMEIAELKKVAADLGVKHHPKAGPTKIVDAIMAAFDGGEVEGDGLPETEEGPSVDQVLEGEQVEVQEPIRPKVQLSSVAEEAKKNKLEAVIEKEIGEWPTIDQLRAALEVYVARGLKIVRLDNELWHFRVANREAAGNPKAPLRTIVQQAMLLFQATAMPTEGMDMEEILALKVPRK